MNCRWVFVNNLFSLSFQKYLRSNPIYNITKYNYETFRNFVFHTLKVHVTVKKQKTRLEVDIPDKWFNYMNNRYMVN